MDNRNFIARRAAKYFKPGDVVNVGIGIPSLCGSYAAEGVMFETENGGLGVGESIAEDENTRRFTNAGGVHYRPVAGASYFSSALSFGMIRGGRMDATVLGGLQVSKDGDLANWSNGHKIFGMGGAMDLVNGVKKVIVAMELCTKEGKPKILNQCTLPLTGLKCVNHIVTELCVIDVTKEGLMLREVREGHTAEEIQSLVEPELIIASDLKVMEE